MKFENIGIYLPILYDKAKESFKECIRDKDNGFLKNEVNIPLEDIKLLEKDIKIVFLKTTFEVYIIEVSLLLFEGSREIGKYLYAENDDNERIDDSLAFY